MAEAGAYDEAARRRADETRAAIRALSTAYHPVDLQTGDLRLAAAIETDFEHAVAVIDPAADALGPGLIRDHPTLIGLVGDRHS